MSRHGTTDVRRISPDRTVREEAVILKRLGWTCEGLDGSGHIRFSHPQYGELTMSKTPRNPKWFRVEHRKVVARRMGMTLFELEQMLAGKPVGKGASAGRTARRRKLRPSRSAVQITPVHAPVLITGHRFVADTETWSCSQCRERFRPTSQDYHRNVRSIQAHGACAGCWNDRVYWQGRSAA